MTVDDAPGTVTICGKSGRRGLFADDHGVTVRTSAHRARRFVWAEISRFEERCRYDGQSGGYVWALVIVLHTGQRVSACGGWYGEHVLKIVTAVRQAADRHGIPADLAGVPMKDGRPAMRGLYHDPGSQAGLRYWDGGQWSPLLLSDIGESRLKDGPQGPDSWSELPTANERWTYAATRARAWTVLSVVCAAISVGLVPYILVVLLWLNQHGQMTSDQVSGAAVFGAVFIPSFALLAWWSRRRRKFYVKLDEAAKRASGSWS